jgi:putative membrane protein
MSIVVSLLINAAALWVATEVVDGISFTGTAPTLLGVALVFGVLNVVVRPILKLLTFPFLTLGLFIFVLNAVMLLLTSAASNALGLGFHVEGFVPALIGALVVSIISYGLSLFVGVGDDKKKD